ncbi:MAG: energy-coupling factor transporter transmembrane component T [[Clostridium] leptum]
MTVLFYLNDNAITAEAILYGLASATMLVSVVMWFSCFNKIMTADKIIYLFGRVIPVVALLISMCFRFIPLLKSRFREIHEAKMYGTKIPQARWSRAAAGKEISILIAWSLEAAIETSDSMEARGYGLHGRTSFHIFKFAKRDRNALIIIAVSPDGAGRLFLGVKQHLLLPGGRRPLPLGADTALRLCLPGPIGTAADY